MAVADLASAAKQAEAFPLGATADTIPMATAAVPPWQQTARSSSTSISSDNGNGNGTCKLRGLSDYQ